MQNLFFNRLKLFQNYGYFLFIGDIIKVDKILLTIHLLTYIVVSKNLSMIFINELITAFC